MTKKAILLKAQLVFSVYKPLEPAYSLVADD